MLDWLKRLFRRTTPAEKAAEELAVRKANEERLQRDLGRIIEKVNAKPTAKSVPPKPTGTPTPTPPPQRVRVEVVPKTKGR
jgi:hypothetical protein